MRSSLLAMSVVLGLSSTAAAATCRDARGQLIPCRDRAVVVAPVRAVAPPVVVNHPAVVAGPVVPVAPARVVRLRCRDAAGAWVRCAP